MFFDIITSNIWVLPSQDIFTCFANMKVNSVTFVEHQSVKSLSAQMILVTGMLRINRLNEYSCIFYCSFYLTSCVQFT